MAITSRRSFLSKLLGVWGVLTAAPIGVAFLDFITPAKRASSSTESLRIAEIDDIPVNTAKVVRFDKEPVIVVHTQSGQFKAFSARCTHLGCIVKYEGEESPPHFSCACHGSEFNMSGQNISGPAPSPLAPLRVAIRDSGLVVSRV